LSGIFVTDGKNKKTETEKSKTYMHPPHRRLRKLVNMQRIRRRDCCSMAESSSREPRPTLGWELPAYKSHWRRSTADWCRRASMTTDYHSVTTRRNLQNILQSLLQCLATISSIFLLIFCALLNMSNGLCLNGWYEKLCKFKQ